MKKSQNIMKIIVDLSLNKNILIVFHNLKNYDSHLIFQEIGKYSFKINVIVKAIEKCMCFIFKKPENERH